MEDRNKTSSVSLLETLKSNKSSIHIRNAHDAVTILLHSIMRSQGFEFVGCGETNDAKASEKFVTESWNREDGSYTFRYKHPKKQNVIFLIKCIVLGDNLLVHGLTEGDQATFDWEVRTTDFIRQKTFDDVDNLYKDVEKLRYQFLSNIVFKLLPSEPSPQNTANPDNRNPYNDPLRVPPRNPNPYGNPYADPYASDPHGGGGGFGHVPPFGIGSNDLFPPMGGPFGMPNGGSGNLFGPDHPGFGSRDPYQPSPFGGRGGQGRGYPQGARFDPFMPPGFGGPGPRPPFNDF
eukprot:TRINITY_DN2667_c0_g1_i1.p1 TRINITY_DN2667_c0_g1~~TRINITY_DN2667_c0_g1_i1.p1  ORF type:complete len:299 (-),score=23.76 TRINITY_DN2667_c0_g1_i1:18-890(-)